MGEPKHRYTLHRIYPEGLRGLREIVRASVTPATLGVGPFSAFLEFIEENYRDWRLRRRARGHLVGMGMGSINDLGGPGSQFPGGKASFGRFEDGRHWLHNVTWICAEHWVKFGTKWGPVANRRLRSELESASSNARLTVWRCRHCRHLVTTNACVADYVPYLEDAERLAILVEEGGVVCAHALLDARLTRFKELRRKNRQAVRRWVRSQGGELVDDANIDALVCTKCGGYRIGSCEEVGLPEER